MAILSFTRSFGRIEVYL